MFSLSANWLRNMPFAFFASLMACPKALKSYFTLSCFIFFTLLHFTVHLSTLDMITHSIVLTVIEHIFIKNLPMDIEKDLTGEQIVAKIEREQTVAK